MNLENYFMEAAELAAKVRGLEKQLNQIENNLSDCKQKRDEAFNKAREAAMLDISQKRSELEKRYLSLTRELGALLIVFCEQNKKFSPEDDRVPFDTGNTRYCKCRRCNQFDCQRLIMHLGKCMPFNNGETKSCDCKYCNRFNLQRRLYNFFKNNPPIEAKNVDAFENHFYSLDYHNKLLSDAANQGENLELQSTAKRILSVIESLQKLPIEFSEASKEENKNREKLCVLIGHDISDFRADDVAICNCCGKRVKGNGMLSPYELARRHRNSLG